MWRLEVDVEGLSWITHHLYFLRQGLPQTLKHMDLSRPAGWPVSYGDLLGFLFWVLVFPPSTVCLPHAGVAGMHHLAWLFTEAPWIQTQVLTLAHWLTELWPQPYNMSLVYISHIA